MLVLIRLGPAFRYVVLGLTVAAGVLLAFHSGPYWDNELASMSPLACRGKVAGRSAAPRNRRPRCPLSSGRAGAGPGSGAGRKRARRCGPGAACREGHDHRLRRAWYLVAEPRDATHATGGVARCSDAQCQPDRGNRPARRSARTAFLPFLADLEAARNQPLLQREDLNGTSLALRLDSLLVQGSGGWLAMLSLRGVSDAQALADTVAGFGEQQLVFSISRRSPTCCSPPICTRP